MKYPAQNGLLSLLFSAIFCFAVFFCRISCYPLESSSEEGVCACAMIIQKVCGVDGTTYDNPCLARCAGAMITYSGPCKLGALASARSYTRSGKPCFCPKMHNPVCGTNRKTYINSCLAKCNGVKVWQPRACDSPSYRQMEGMTKRFNFGFQGLASRSSSNFQLLQPTMADNSVEISIEGVELHRLCNCAPYYLPRCGTDGYTYANACFAECAGAAVLFPRPC